MGRFLYERGVCVVVLSRRLDGRRDGDGDNGLLFLPLLLSCGNKEAVVGTFAKASLAGILEVVSSCSPFLGWK